MGIFLVTMTTSFVIFEDVDKCVKHAIEDFRNQDRQLLELAVDERAATHCIACYLKKYFPDWNVDCEYNRKGSNPKISPVVGSHGIVRPDIIIHRRNTSDNLLCIEVKKEGEPLDDDRKKLCGFTDIRGQYKYHFGLLIILSLDDPFLIKGTWYQDGKIKESYVFPSG
jgi:hypothetical protein